MGKSTYIPDKSYGNLVISKHRYRSYSQFPSLKEECRIAGGGGGGGGEREKGEGGGELLLHKYTISDEV